MSFKPWYIPSASINDNPDLCQICARINLAWLFENDFSKAQYAHWQTNTTTDNELCPIKLPWVSEHNSYIFPDLSLGFLFEILKRRESCCFCRLVSFTIATAYETVPDSLPEQNFKYAPPELVFCSLWNFKKDFIQGGSYDIIIKLSNIKEGFHSFRQLPLHRIRDDVPIPFEGRSVLPRVDCRAIGDWLGLFADDHIKSTTVHSKLPGFRLIDVVNRNIVPINGPGGCRYLTLSYVWGGPQLFQNIRATEEKLQKPGSLLEHQIPETIQDAIELVAKVGERYLWVDSLCIIQDDGDAKMVQINGMDRIYSCALAAVVAAAGANCHSGLPGVRSTVGRWRQYTADVRGIKLANKYEHTPGTEQQVWATRGWTFQEHALSRRCIHFGHDGLTFESEDGLTREDVHPPPHDPGHMQTPTGVPVGNSIPDLGLISNLQLFALSVSFYSFRSLTYENDAINAFQGVLNIHRPRFRRDFLYGMPSSELETALLWQPNSVLQRRANGDKGDFPFPSWSWVAWKGNLILPVSGAARFSRLEWIDAIDKVTKFTSDEWRSVEMSELCAWKTVRDRGIQVAPWYFEVDNPTARFAHPVSGSVPLAMKDRRFLQPGNHVLTFCALCAQIQSIPGKRSLSDPNNINELAPDGVRSHTLQDRFNSFCGIVYLHPQNSAFDTEALDCVVISRTAYGRQNSSKKEPPFDDSDVVSIRDGYAERQELRRKSLADRSAESYFNSYDFELEWQAYDVLVIARGSNGVSERVGVGFCLCEAFWDAEVRHETVMMI